MKSEFDKRIEEKMIKFPQSSSKNKEKKAYDYGI